MSQWTQGEIIVKNIGEIHTKGPKSSSPKQTAILSLGNTLIAAGMQFWLVWGLGVILHAIWISYCLGQAHVSISVTCQPLRATSPMICFEGRVKLDDCICIPCTARQCLTAETNPSTAHSLVSSDTKLPWSLLLPPAMSCCRMQHGATPTKGRAACALQESLSKGNAEPPFIKEIWQ